MTVSMSALKSAITFLSSFLSALKPNKSSDVPLRNLKGASNWKAYFVIDGIRLLTGCPLPSTFASSGGAR